MKIIGIIGARARHGANDFEDVRKAFLGIYERGDWICSGGCGRGGDEFAKRLQREFSTPYLEFPANWQNHGKQAGFIRNGEIAKHSTILIACVVPGAHGGTEDTIANSGGNIPKDK